VAALGLVQRRLRGGGGARRRLLRGLGGAGLQAQIWAQSGLFVGGGGDGVLGEAGAVVQPAVGVWAASRRRSPTTSTPGWSSRCLCGLLRLRACKARSRACATAYWRGTVEEGLAASWGCRVKYVLVVAPFADV
jgi:hypothetical protein